MLAAAASSCVWAAVQTKSTRSSSHLVLLKLGDRRSARRFGGRKMLQSKIKWLADCSSAPQMDLGVSTEACPSGTSMYHSGWRQFSVYSVLPTDSGVAMSRWEANGRGDWKLRWWCGTFPCRYLWLQEIEAGVQHRRSMAGEGASWMHGKGYEGGG